MQLIIHNDEGLADTVPQVYADRIARCRRVNSRMREYTLCKSPPNYPVPAIRTHYRLINWHGKMIFVVTRDHEWNGFEQLVADYNL